MSKGRKYLQVLAITGFPHRFSDALYQRIAEESDIDLILVTTSHNHLDQKPGIDARVITPRLLHATLDSLGSKDDPHRIYLKPLHLYLRKAHPDIIVGQFEQESVAAAQTAFMSRLFKPGAPLTLYSWQNILRKRSIWVHLVDTLTLRRANHITCASSEAVEVLRQKGFRGTTSIAPMIGVDVRYFFRQPESVIRDWRTKYTLSGFVVGYAGRLVSDKGIDILIDAFSQLDVPSTLAIIGSGEEAVRLKLQAEKLGIINQCRFIEHVSHEQIPMYLNMLDVLVLPSRTTSQWKEQFGRVLVEAMACGVPVMGSDSGAIPEVISDAGLVFREGDKFSLLTNLNTLINNPLLQKSLSYKGLRRAHQYYCLEALANQTATVWRNLLTR